MIQLHTRKLLYREFVIHVADNNKLEMAIVLHPKEMKPSIWLCRTPCKTKEKKILNLLCLYFIQVKKIENTPQLTHKIALGFYLFIYFLFFTPKQ